MDDELVGYFNELYEAVTIWMSSPTQPPSMDPPAVGGLPISRVAEVRVFSEVGFENPSSLEFENTYPIGQPSLGFQIFGVSVDPLTQPHAELPVPSPSTL